MNIIDRQTFRDAVFYIGATVNIITTDGPAGRAGFTASAVCSVTGMPPTLLVCPDCGALVWSAFNENRMLYANAFGAGQEPLSNLSGGKTPTGHRFVATRQQTGVTGCPQLEEALVSFDYRISQVVSIGTHDILFYATEAIHHHTTPYGLAWSNRSYHALVRPAR